jgi:glycosyltransferase involved in cell wall biosynthesis
MKILVCHNYYQQRGGEDQFFEDEAKLLESRGHEVIRYTTHNDSIKDRGLLSVAAKTLWNKESAEHLACLVKQHRPHVLHAVNTFPLFSPSIFHAARKLNLPTVASVQNYRSFCAQSMCFRDGKSCEACLGKIPWRAVKNACYRGSRTGSAVVAAMQMLHRHLRTWQTCVDVICVASEFSKSKLVAAGFDANQMINKPNFVSVDPGQQSGDGKFALFVGRLAGEKGVDTLLEAWDKHQLSYPLKIVGDGPGAPLVKAAARKQPGIEWIGRVPNEQVYDWMGRAACLIFPSVGYESMPKTLIESMAVGTPVIGADTASVPEVVLDGRTGHVFKGGNADSLAEKVKQFFASESDWQAMRSRCRQEFESRFTADQNYQLLMKIYLKSIQKKGLAPPEAYPIASNSDFSFTQRRLI